LYPFESEDKFRKRYRPDFYLPDYDLYLEHFGVDKKGRAPWLPKIEEQKYLDDMAWKRAFHKRNRTTLIETYSYYNTYGRLLIELDKNLKNNGVIYKKVDYLEIFNE
jgi:DNA helicase-4